MPVSETGVGHSSATIHKQHGLRKVLEQHICIVSSVVRKHHWADKTYNYIDTTAGSGWNAAENCAGSPVIFEECMARAMIPFRSVLIDRSKENTEELTRRCSSRAEILCGDHTDIVPQLTINPSSFGLLYHDPNGAPSWDMIRDVAHQHKRIDVLIRVPASGCKRNPKCHPLDEIIPTIGKSTWIIRDIVDGDKWQWTFLFGSNYSDYKAWERHGFRRTTSLAGRATLMRCSSTNKQLEQMALFCDDARDVVRTRSGGVCEKCHTRQASEIHHHTYNAVDVPETMIAVCHHCHCRFHGTRD